MKTPEKPESLVSQKAIGSESRVISTSLETSPAALEDKVSAETMTFTS